MSAPPRYCPGRAFPRYAFLPGQDPHPTRDPAGHSYRTEPEPPAPYYPLERWSENEDYLHGIDLYNHGYLWEAHEVWEGLWHAAKHDPLQAEILQGLIQCSAAALKIRMGQPRGLQRLAELGCERLARAARSLPEVSMGLRLAELAADFRAFAARGPTEVESRPLLLLEG